MNHNKKRYIPAYFLALLSLLLAAPCSVLSEGLTPEDSIGYRLSIHNNTDTALSAVFYTVPNTGSGAMSIASQQTADIRINATQMLFVLLQKSIDIFAGPSQFAQSSPISVNLQVNDTDAAGTSITGCEIDSPYTCVLTPSTLATTTTIGAPDAQSTTLRSQTLTITNRATDAQSVTDNDTDSPTTTAQDDTQFTSAPVDNAVQQPSQEHVYDAPQDPLDSNATVEMLKQIWKLLISGYNG